MRTLRLSLAGTVMLVLLGVWTVSASAQDAADDEWLDPIPAAYFTGTWGEVIATESPDEWDWRFDSAGFLESLSHEHVVAFEASDPRISGTWTQVSNMRVFPIDPHEDIGIPVGSSAMRIVNEKGAWAGFCDGYYGDLSGEWCHLEGEGEHEGLTAVFRWKPEDDSYEGIIFPGVPPEHPAPIPAE